MSQDISYLWTDALFTMPTDLAKFRRGLAIFLAEMFGVFIFVSLGCSSLVSTVQVPNVLNHFNSTVAFVFGIALAVWIAQPISNSVLNPALSVGAVILGHMSIYRCLLYIVAQLTGGFMGALLNYLLVPDLDSDYCRQRRQDAINPEIAFLYEFLFSALLAWALCGLIDKRRTFCLRNLAIKFLVLLIPIILNITAIFGSNLNPAVAFGGAMVALNFKDFWIFFCGPFVGVITWAFIYRFLFDASIEEQSGAKTQYNVTEYT